MRIFLSSIVFLHDIIIDSFVYVYSNGISSRIYNIAFLTSCPCVEKFLKIFRYGCKLYVSNVSKSYFVFLMMEIFTFESYSWNKLLRYGKTIFVSTFLAKARIVEIAYVLSSVIICFGNGFRIVFDLFVFSYIFYV